MLWKKVFQLYHDTPLPFLNDTQHIGPKELEIVQKLSYSANNYQIRRLQCFFKLKIKFWTLCFTKNCPSEKRARRSLDNSDYLNSAKCEQNVLFFRSKSVKNKNCIFDCLIIFLNFLLPIVLKKPSFKWRKLQWPVWQWPIKP